MERGSYGSGDDSSFEDSYTEYSYDPESDNALENGDESILDLIEASAEDENENGSEEGVDQDDGSQGSNEDGEPDNSMNNL